MSLPDDYPSLLTVLDAWHAEAARRHPGVIPCRAGCSACCHGPFDISVADALLVRDAVGALPAEARAEVRRRAEAQMARMREAEAGLEHPWDMTTLGEDRFDALVQSLETEACPVLDDAGRCRIYGERPMVCRMMGLGVETSDGQVIENACPIQDDFPAYRALEPQELDLDAWDAAEAPLRTIAAVRLFGSAEWSEYETTVAGAVLLDQA